jgi:hypothetical protein
MKIKKIVFIAFLSSGLFGCVSFSRQYEIRPFFSGFGQKFDCGNGKRTPIDTLCRLDSFGY